MSLNNRDREQLALSLLLLISQNFYQRKPPISIDKIVSEVSLPMKAVEEVLRCYEDAGILHRVQNAQLAYLPAMPLENLTVVEAYQTIRKSYAIFSPVLVHNAQSNLVLPIIQRIDSSVERELGEMTIKQLVEMQEENNSPVNYTVAQL